MGTRASAVPVGATVPPAVPGVPLDLAPKLAGSRRAALGKRLIPAPLRQGGELLQHLVQQEPQPHALSLPEVTTRVFRGLLEATTAHVLLNCA